MQNKFEIISLIGEGSYGIVYKAKNRDTGEIIAIKKLKSSKTISESSNLTYRELSALKQLKHKNIVSLKESFKHKGHYYLVFEYMDKNLLDVINENPKGLDPTLIRTIISQICQGLLYMHTMSIIHRDIKPENILINKSNEVKICDFGFSRKVDGIMTDYVATRWYRAPELLNGESKYGVDVDFWGVGCVMGELVDGNPMFPGDTDKAVLSLITAGNGTYHDLNSKYSTKLDKPALSFLKGLLEINPMNRLKGNELARHPYLSLRQYSLPNINKVKLSEAIDEVVSCGTSNAQGKVVSPKTLQILKGLLTHTHESKFCPIRATDIPQEQAMNNNPSLQVSNTKHKENTKRKDLIRVNYFRANGMPFPGKNINAQVLKEDEKNTNEKIISFKGNQSKSLMKIYNVANKERLILNDNTHHTVSKEGKMKISLGNSYDNLTLLTIPVQSIYSNKLVFPAKGIKFPSSPIDTQNYFRETGAEGFKQGSETEIEAMFNVNLKYSAILKSTVSHFPTENLSFQSTCKNSNQFSLPMLGKIQIK